MNLIRVGSWSTPRAVGVRGGKLAVQVKLSLCRTCGACQERERWVRERLEKLGISAEWEKEGEVVVIPLPPASTDAEKLAHLERLFGLPVRLVA